MAVEHDTLIIIPAFNEESNIKDVLSRILDETAYRHIVVIDDGSTDRTAAIIKEMGVNILKLPFNLGIGAAVQAGYRYAQKNGYDYVVRIDADGQHEVDNIESILDPVVADETDIAIGSRYLVSDPFKSSLARLTGMIILSRIVSWIVGKRITDPTSGFRAVNRAVISIFCRNYPDDYPEVESIVLLHRTGFRIKEVGVKMVERAGGKSSITFAQSIYYMIKVLLAVGVELLRKSREREKP